ncbi:MAG: hypothetical protein ABIQ16_05780 [Polyangiaceae bacterium]
MLWGPGRSSFALFSCALFAAACAGSAPPAQDPSASAGPVIPDKAAVTPPSAEDAEPKADDEPKRAPKEEVVEPTFTADMSVEDAIKAAQATERLNVDQETMSKPLEEQSLYEPCKPGTTHFNLRVAVWRGKAVAVDVSSTPKNPKLVECLKGRIRELTWPAKVPSLNTVEYAM